MHDVVWCVCYRLQVFSFGIFFCEKLSVANVMKGVVQ